MARVDMNVNRYIIPTVWNIKGGISGNDWKVELKSVNKINTDLPVEYKEDLDTYADNKFKATESMLTINELVEDRKVIQRKIDAVRKRLKRITDKLHVTESEWLSQ